jgi:hypothetical protein
MTTALLLCLAAAAAVTAFRLGRWYGRADCEQEWWRGYGWGFDHGRQQQVARGRLWRVLAEQVRREAMEN